MHHSCVDLTRELCTKAKEDRLSVCSEGDAMVQAFIATGGHKKNPSSRSIDMKTDPTVMALEEEC